MKKINTYLDPLKSPSPDMVSHNILTPTKVKYGYNMPSDKGSKSNKKLQTQLVQENKQLKAQNEKLVSIIEKFNQSHNPPRKNQQLIEKIKEQYQQNINTLKQMLSQEVERCVDWIQQICTTLNQKLAEDQNRIALIQKQLTTINLNRAQKTINQLSTSHHISQLYCQSIPQESFQQSRNSQPNKQITKLNAIISQLQQSYSKEKQQLLFTIKHKDQEIQSLKHISYKQELLLIKSDAQSLSQQVNTLQSQYKDALNDLEEKGIEMERMSREIIHLQQKIKGSEQHRMILEEKNRYLQSNTSLLEQEVKEKKNTINQLKQEQYRAETQKVEKYKEINPINTETIQKRITQLIEMEGH